MRIEKEKKRGRKKGESSSALQAINFDIAAIREIKRRKKRLCERGPKKK